MKLGDAAKRNIFLFILMASAAGAVILVNAALSPRGFAESAANSEEKQVIEESMMAYIKNKGYKALVLGGGCFWCVEAVFDRIDGVKETTSGYAGGTKPNPTYEEVSSGTTGHAEVVRIIYDPTIVSLDDLDDVFFEAHDPTTLNRQGADVGSQYRSIMLYADQDEKNRARQALERAQKNYSNPIVTEIVPLDAFYPAENYHQDYFDRNRNASYCRFVISPKLKKLNLPQ